MSQSWTGAWEWLSENHDGRTAFTEKHFCYASAPKARKLPVGEKPNDAEAATLLKSFGVAVAGIYTVKQQDDEWLFDSVHLIDLVPDRVGIHEHNVIWVHGDRTFNQGFKPDGTRGPVPPLQYSRLSQLGYTSLAGTWKLISNMWDGLMIMTDHHYRFVMTHKDRIHVSGKLRKISNMDAVTLYHSFDAQCGSYSIVNSHIIRQPVVVKNPRDKGREIKVEFLLDGDRLTTHLDKQSLVWKSI